MKRLLHALLGAGIVLAPALAAASDRAQAPPAAAGAPDARATYLSLIREMRAQQPYAALAHVAGYEARWGASADTAILRADALRATGQDEAAAAAYRQLLAGPQAAAAFRGLGLMAAGAGHWDAAVGHLGNAARLDPTDAATQSDLGLAHLRSGRPDAARIPLMTAAQLAPADSRILANLASYFLASGQQAQADAVLRSPHLSVAARALLQEQADAARRVEAPAPGPGLRMEHSLALDGAAVRSALHSERPGP